MITENFVSFEIAKLLKEKGFREVCSQCYGVAVSHNGENISFDEECELKDEGRENEIEYIEGGMLYDFNYQNSDDDSKICAAPTLWGAMKWLREVHKIFIEPFVSIDLNGKYHYGFRLLNSICKNILEPKDLVKMGFKDTYEEACEASIKYTLENLI